MHPDQLLADLPARAGRVVVIGSINIDSIFSVEQLPAPGETRIASSAQEALGGKGQSQAISAARFGAEVQLCGAVGEDPAGALARAQLAAVGVDIALVRRGSQPTGRAIVFVDSAAENCIVVSQGANTELRTLDVADREAIRGADVLLTQLEAGARLAFEAIKVAHAHGVRVVLNAAPAAVIPPEILRCVDFLIVNRPEVAELGGSAEVDIAAARLAEEVGTVLVTLGSEGGGIYRHGELAQHLPALRVQPVDTTGAGDTACGVFAAGIAQALDPTTAFQLALIAGSLATLKHGNAPAIPNRAAIVERYREALALAKP